MRLFLSCCLLSSALALLTNTDALAGSKKPECLYVKNGYCYTPKGSARPSSGQHNQCRALYAKWKKYSHWKVWAENNINKAGQNACGFSYGYSTKKGAIDRALSECRKQDTRLKFGVSGTCHIVRAD